MPLYRTTTIGEAAALELAPADNAGTGALAELRVLKNVKPLGYSPAVRLDRLELIELRDAIDEALA